MKYVKNSWVFFIFCKADEDGFENVCHLENQCDVKGALTTCFASFSNIFPSSYQDKILTEATNQIGVGLDFQTEDEKQNFMKSLFWNPIQEQGQI